ncbi:MAG: SDR family NAD(P)-dependent oxidoreductase, partial [Acidobacteriota bacterium]|nr:SDR family NAD(P)-dependent oxidoreductase [Acidobacteriota bacterium]
MSEPRSVPELTPELARAIRARQEKAARLRRRIAVVGMSCRFPAGASVAEFQRSLLAGRDAVTSGPPHARGSASGAALAGYLERVDRLDAGFFRISPAEAEVMDPQQRLLLEVSWEALEDAGLDPGKERRGAVYVGIGSGDYQALLEGVRPSVHTLTGTSFAAASGRIAFTLGWTGPALAVDTACSSSLVAIHQAMAALQRREADLALAGGVNVILKPGLAPVFQEAGMLAPDGRCKTFDAAADGFGRGEGCGMLVLKRLADAEREGDRILGVLLGSALNQDGASAGLTVPNGLAQEQVIREALRRAGVPPASVDYLEAHGTGTSLGDPIEAQAAGAVYGEGREPGRPLLIGSVKTNIGHLEAAAGVAGVIKVLLALRAGVIPKHLHCETPSPRIAWDSLPLAVTTEETPWPEITDRPRRAAVSSFALSGTNAHVVLEQYPSQQGPSVLIAAQPGAPAPGVESGRAPPAGAAPLTERPRRVLPLSARSGKALGELAARYREWLPRESGKKAVERLADAAWTAGVGRSHFPVRAGLAFGGANELSEQLLALENRAESIAATPAGGGVAFLYTGQGSQWAGMGRDLYGTEPLFREILDRCEAAFMEERGTGLLPVMFGEAPGLERTEWTQPALFALSAALTELWRAVGVVPDAVLGHSVGEVGAAWAAGAIGLEEGLRFAARRGALMGSLSAGGAMTAVFGDPDRVGGAGVALAAENGTHVVLSGPEDQIALTEKRAGGLGIRTERLRTSHAFHSPLMDPVLGELESAAGELGWNTPQAAFVSGVTGGVLEGGGSADARYWRRQAREPVRFASGVRALAERGADVLIEIGPRPVLGPLAALAWPASEPGAFPSVLAGPGPERDFPEAVSAAYEAGLRIAFEGLHAGERRRRVSLPTYPFQRERYWVRPRRRVSDWTAAPGAAAVLGSRWELGSGEVAFESELGSPLPDWITRHRLFGRIVAPASLYAVQAAASLATPGRRAGEAESVEVDSVRIERPLVLSDDEEGGRQVQFLLGVERGASARSWEVFSRGSEDGPWVRHATGRVRRASREEGRRDLVDVARLSADLSPAVPEGGLDRLWTGADEAVGEVAALSAHEEDGGLHAALFSACLATAAGFPGLELSSAESVWLPVGWDLLWFVREPPDRVFCHARRLAAAADGAERVDFTLCDPDGLVLGALRGLALRRTPRSVLLRVLDDVEDLFYEVVWREAPEAGGAGPVSADFLRGPAGVSLEAPSGDSVFAAEGLAGAAREARDEGLEQLARATALRAFAELGGEPRGDEPFETARRRLKVVAPHAGVMRRMLALARPGGAAPEDPDELADRLLARCPAASVEIGLLRRCGEALSEVLRGRADPLDLLFGGTPSAADLYREAPVSRALSRLVGEAVAAAARTLPAGRRLRILEVGAGTGGTTAAVLAAVPQGQTDYLFTDVSTAFFRDAEKRFAASAAAAGVGLEFRTLDIERDPGPQGLTAHGYDIVIAANVLHATEDLAASLAWCRRLLAPSGLLVALEALAPRGWLDLTFGLLTGWWRFADSYRQGHPLVGASVWRRALADAGYQDVATLGSEEAATHTGSAVILGRGPAETSPEAGLWVVTSGDRGPGAELVRALEARGQRVATPPPTGEIVGREGWRERFADLPAGELTGVVHLGALSVPCASEAGEDREEDPAADLDRLGSSALSLVQGMFDAGVAPRSGLWFVTRGGQVVDDESSEGLSGAALWGFGRAVSRELTGFGTQLLDLDPNEPVSVGRLADELLYPDGETQLALRAGRRLVPRLTPGVRPGGRSGGSPRGDRAYLVTGGLGRLGLQVAGWLAREGAGAIVLNGRRPPGDRAAGVIDGLRAGGAEVRVELGDIADPEAAARIVACIGSEGSGLPPFGGVFHCAGVLRDAALVGEDWPRFAEVLRPKLAGAWNLHRATARLDLDRFVLFSSVMGVVGNAGQSAYAAANATLDQLALRRRAAGLAGQSIAWGLWSDVGEDARDRERVQRRVEAIGMGWIRPELGLRAFGRLMAEDAPHVVVAPVDWTVFRGAVDAPQPFLKEVAPSGADRPGAPAPVRPDLLARLRDEPPARRPKIMLHFVQQEVRAVLRLRSNPSPDVGFFDLGMDSLMAVELRNRLNQAFAGVSVVPNTVVFDYPTPVSLGRRLLEELGELPAPAALPAPRIAASAVEERIAVVGLACRFPGGPDAGGFWAQLAAGGEAVTRGRPGPLVPGDEPGGAAPFGGYVTGLDRFDAEFFRIAPVEAESLDPQQRLLLEVSWEALEDAGFDPAGLKGSRSGVFVGISHSDYRGLLDVTPGDSVRSLYLATGTSLSAAIGRVAFVLGLTGPAIAVDTACSSSLVAIHQAVAALQRNEVELALSGGVNAILVPGFTQVLEDAQMLSPDGRCRTFDARADGFVRG